VCTDTHVYRHMQLSFNVFSWPLEPAETKGIMIFISNAQKYARMHMYTCTHISFFILSQICMAAMALCLLEYCATTPVEFLDSNQILTPDFFGVLYKVKKKALCGGYIQPSMCILVSATQLLRHILFYNSIWEIFKSYWAIPIFSCTEP
jgi:hypothetical protein